MAFMRASKKKKRDGLLMNKELGGEEKFWLIKKSG